MRLKIKVVLITLIVECLLGIICCSTLTIRYESDDVIWLRNHASTWILVPNIGCKQTMASNTGWPLTCFLCIRQRKPWTPPPQGSTQIRRRDDVESWGVYFQRLVNLDLINFLTMWIFTLCEFRPGESWTNAVYISSENVSNTKIDCSKNVLLIVVLVEYKLKWMCC